MTSRNPVPLFGGWYSYREWADHGFIAREPHETASGSGSEEPPPDAPGDLPPEPDEIAQGREAAARLAASAPGWFLIYGPASRKIWAYPTSPRAPQGLVLADQDPARLHALIQRTEQQFGFAPNSGTERSAHPTTSAT